jgi:hypothetical protein
MSTLYNDYLNNCKKAFAAHFKQKGIVSYMRDSKNNPIGVLIARKDSNNNVWIGWSRCNKKTGDTWNKYIGFDRATLPTKYVPCFNVATKQVHNSFNIFLKYQTKEVRYWLELMRDRAMRYYKR